MAFWVLCLLGLVLCQPTVPSTSATVTTTSSPTSSPNSVSVTRSVSSSPQSVSSTPSVSRTPWSASVTPSVTISPFASLTGRWCQRDSCIVGSCITGSRCCSGFCINDAYVTATIPIGGLCTASSYSVACTLCQRGLSCDPATNRCVVYGMGYGCPSTCSATPDCAAGLMCTANNRCGFRNLGVGARCNPAATCYSGLTCTNGFCTPIAMGNACTASNQPYDPSAKMTDPYPFLDGACERTLYCSGACVAKKSVNSACTGPQECQTGICNAGFCANAGSIGSQGACSTQLACQDGLFCGAGACQPKVGQGARCTQSTTLPYTIGAHQSTWCASGLMCSLFDNERPICMPGNLPIGALCFNSDQCSPLSSWGCLADAGGEAVGRPGKCSGNSAGMPCLLGNSTWCGSQGRGVCGTCTNTDGRAPGSWVCNAPPAPATCVDERAAAVQALWTAGYAQADDGGLAAAIALAGHEEVIKLFCCTSCTDGEPNLSQGDINRLAAVFGRPVDCRNYRAGPPWTGTTRDNVCSGTATIGQTVPVPAEQFLGSCRYGGRGTLMFGASAPNTTAFFAFDSGAHCRAFAAEIIRNTNCSTDPFSCSAPEYNLEFTEECPVPVGLIAGVTDPFKMIVGNGDTERACDNIGLDGVFCFDARKYNVMLNHDIMDDCLYDYENVTVLHAIVGQFCRQRLAVMVAQAPQPPNDTGMIKTLLGLRFENATIVAK